MKASRHFIDTIQAELERRAQTDSRFAERLALESKSIEDCISYILNTVQKSGMNGFADDEIYGMAVHYYDEDDVEVGKTPNMRVVVNHVPELSAEEIEEAKQQAIREAVQAEKQRITSRKSNSAKPKPQQLSLL